MKQFLFLCILLSPLSAVRGDDKPLPPNEAPRRMTLPDGFHATLFAGEPDIVQPIAFAFDDRGRLWAAECRSYPQWIKDGKSGRDRILIFEDADGDGRFDKRTIFYDKIANISGLEFGFGGVWVCATPQLLFIPDRDGNDVPDGPPEVVLDGWDINAKHNVFNGLTWGPDGWLYGCNGILSNSKVGKPGAPDSQRVALNCGVWRLHPLTRTFELVATGTTNPWGLAFDDFGQPFITNCVIHHLWHVIPGAHYQRMFGQDFNPHWYALMSSCADHIHWGGGSWQSSRGAVGSHGVAGGGHAHSGAMIYLADDWPAQYRNGLFTCNIHGSRVNHDRLERQGSGYVARHAKDLLLANDSWFRGIAIHQGSEGAVYVSDWTDTGECHNYAEVDRSNGRIYKISFGPSKPFRENFAKLSDAALVERVLNSNDWHSRHARRLLQERHAAGQLAADAISNLRMLLNKQIDVRRKLRTLWALHVTAGVDENELLNLLESPHEEMRAWAVTISLENRRPSAQMRQRLAERARNDLSAHVRLALASGLQRLTIDDRWPIALRLVAHEQDSMDANIPLMLWYGIEPTIAAHRANAAHVVTHARIPLVREFAARRLVHVDGGLAEAVKFLDASIPSVCERDILRGLQEALSGQRRTAMPEGWARIAARLRQSADAEIRERAVFLSALFGDGQAFATLRELASNRRAAPAERQRALHILIHTNASELAPLLQELVRDADLRGHALRGLAAAPDPKTPEIILRYYSSFTAEEKSDAVQTLASRPAFALTLLDAVERQSIPKRDLSAFTVRQLQGLKNPEITRRLNHVWGAIRPASAKKSALMQKYKSLLVPEYLQNADRSQGRMVFDRNCGGCHRLFDSGGEIGPNLTGAQRNNLDYVLENLLDPSAVVFSDYQVTTIETKNGRVIHGIIKQETERAVTVQTQNESVIVPKIEIESRSRSAQSLMPEGSLAQLKNEEIRNLIAYLASAVQVPLPQSQPIKK